ncbi:MAG: LURP-one-related family protein [Promethearchaeota archaeon]
MFIQNLKCPECGKSFHPNQRFCEYCGTELSKIKNNVSINEFKGKSAQTKKIVPILKGGLFDLNRNYYILKEKFWDFGSGDILDETNKVIGRMKRIFLSIRKRIELQELDGTVSATIHSKIVSARGAQDLKDTEGNLIARIKKKILSFLHPLFYLEDPKGNRWYEAQGEFMGWSYKIKDLSTGKIVAEVEKADRWRDIFLGGLFDFKDTYALRILDNETDRRILLGFVISIDNVLFDNRHGNLGFIPFGIPREGGGRFPRKFPRPGPLPNGKFPRIRF